MSEPYIQKGFAKTDAAHHTPAPEAIQTAVEEVETEEEGVTLYRNKRSKVVHVPNRWDDNYLACGYLIWPLDPAERFDVYKGDMDEITCEKCITKWINGTIGDMPTINIWG